MRKSTEGVEVVVVVSIGGRLVIAAAFAAAFSF